MSRQHVRSRPRLRLAIALSTPLLAWALQLAVRPVVGPHAFVFIPAVYLSGCLSGPRGGLAATAIGTVGAWFCYFRAYGDTSSLILFALVGVLFSITHELAFCSADRAARACADTARTADRERIARDLHDHVIQQIFAAGMRQPGRPVPRRRTARGRVEARGRTDRTAAALPRRRGRQGLRHQPGPGRGHRHHLGHHLRPAPQRAASGCGPGC